MASKPSGVTPLTRSQPLPPRAPAPARHPARGRPRDGVARASVLGPPEPEQSCTASTPRSSTTRPTSTRTTCWSRSSRRPRPAASATPTRSSPAPRSTTWPAELSSVRPTGLECSGEPAVETLVIDGRFRGPARSGNGSYSAGSLADRPAKTDGAWPRPRCGCGCHRRSTSNGRRARRRHDRATFDGEVVAQAWPVEPVAGPTVSVEAARAAEATYPGLTHTRSRPASRAAPAASPATGCGLPRAGGRGGRPDPGRLDLDPPPERRRRQADPRLAAGGPWSGRPSTRGAWAADVGERPMVLGGMAARVASLPSSARPTSWWATTAAGTDARTPPPPALYDPAGAWWPTADTSRSPWTPRFSTDPGAGH